MAKRTLQELNLLDDFLFGSVVSYPNIGEIFVRELLNTILGKTFESLTIIPQKTYYGSDTEMHGARLDVYLEASIESQDIQGNTTVYDVEPDQNDNSRDKKALPKRMRFYHAKIDAGSLEAGESYQNLNNVVVILFTPYVPFEEDHVLYTVRNRCDEIPEMPYEDGACTLYLYTKGKKGNVSEGLRQLLRYMEHTTGENVCNESLQKIHRMVETVKRDGRLEVEYMKVFEREEMLINKGRREGREAELANTERERKRAEAAESNTERERKRAEEAEKEVHRLRDELEKLR